MMRKFMRKAAIGMAAVLMAGSLAACSVNTGDGVAKYGDEVISTDEAEFWLRFEQWTTEAYYWDFYTSYMGVENMWEAAYTDTQTMAEYMHETVMAQILQTRILLDNASAYGVEELTDSQKEAAAEVIDSFLESYPTFADQVNASTEDMYSYMEMNAKANLVIQAIKDAADVTVEEAEYAKYGVQYVLVNAPDEETDDETEAADETAEEAEDETALEGMELAGAILEAVNGGQDLEEAAEAYDLTAYSTSYLLEGETSEDVRYAATKDLNAGEVNLTETDDGWYVVVRTNDYDEDASETERESLISEREAAAFEEVYAQLAESAAKFTVNESRWSAIAITEKIYEEPEVETEEAEVTETEAAEEAETVEGAETESVEETESETEAE